MSGLEPESGAMEPAPPAGPEAGVEAPEPEAGAEVEAEDEDGVWSSLVVLESEKAEVRVGGPRFAGIATWGWPRELPGPCSELMAYPRELTLARDVRVGAPKRVGGSEDPTPLLLLLL